MTRTKSGADYKQCLTCDDREEPPPLDLSQCTRSLIYHIAPFAKNETWRRNVDQILRRIDLFNGKRIVAIVTGKGLVEPDEVKREFRGEVQDFIVAPNNSKLREVVTFVPLLERVETLNPSHVTFYAHAKGVTRPVNDGVTVHRWADILYETCLDYWPLVQELLENRPLAGSFKKVGKGFSGSASSWHYSGTFYWFRNRDVFSRDWRTVDRKWYGTESWPGLAFRADEAGVIFHEGRTKTLDLYSMDYLRGVVYPELETWRAANASKRADAILHS